MTYNNFIKKINYWDRLMSKWMIRHFYFIFFQTVLVIIFIFWFINTIKTIDLSFQILKTNMLQRILMAQSINTSIIVLLIILNSFWLLFIFNTLQRVNNNVRDINYKFNNSKNRNNDHRKKQRNSDNN